MRPVGEPAISTKARSTAGLRGAHIGGNHQGVAAPGSHLSTASCWAAPLRNARTSDAAVRECHGGGATNPAECAGEHDGLKIKSSRHFYMATMHVTTVLFGRDPTGLSLGPALSRTTHLRGPE